MIDKISSQTVLRFHLSDKCLKLEHVIICRIDGSQGRGQVVQVVNVLATWTDRGQDGLGYDLKVSRSGILPVCLVSDVDSDRHSVIGCDTLNGTLGVEPDDMLGISTLFPVNLDFRYSLLYKISHFISNF
jgi:hypothetical protein